MHAKYSSIFLHGIEICTILAYFLSKLGCHGNSLGFLEILDSIFEVADTNNLTIHASKLLDFLHRTEISEILAYFFPSLVAMATP